MADQLAVIIAPDLVSADQQSVLNAALYFDVVYADCYSFSRTANADQPVVSRGAGELEFSLESQFNSWGSFAALRDAQILRRPPDADRMNYATVEFGDVLPAPLQELVAKSIRGGAVLSVVEWVIKAVLARSRVKSADTPESASRTRLEITLPANIDVDTLTSDVPAPTRALALSFQLATMLNTLELSAVCSATPLFGAPINAELAHAVALQFPAIAAGLGRSRFGTIPWNHAALATTVLNDALLDIQVRDAEDILALRELLGPELTAFRAELGRLTVLMRSQPWQDEFITDAEAIIATNIRPQLTALERRLAKPSRRILKHLVSDWKSVSAASLLPFSACVVQGGDVAWATLAGICAGLGVAAIQAKLEEWSIRDESALTFLVEARSKQKNRRPKRRPNSR
jgi:hypothetical protein